jgi:hypothetical protein
MRVYPMALLVVMFSVGMMSQAKCDCPPKYSGSIFAGNACYLDTKFDPTKNYTGANYAKPQCVSPKKRLTTPQLTLLANAFNIASAPVKRQLCDLTQVFVTPLRDSWGFWEAPDQSSAAGSYVALSVNVFQSNFDLGYSENYVLTRLLSGWNSAAAGFGPPSYNSTSGAPPEQAVLAWLAHELGHVLFYVVNAPNLTTPPGRRSQPNTCYDQYFLSEFNTRNARRFVLFGDDNMNKHSNGSATVHDINVLIKAGKYPQARAALADLLTVPGTGQWVSLFATLSPEEDFVETYRMMALYKAGIQHLYFTLPKPGGSDSIDFMSDLNAANNKTACITNLGIAP